MIKSLFLSFQRSYIAIINDDLKLFHPEQEINILALKPAVNLVYVARTVAHMCLQCFSPYIFVFTIQITQRPYGPVSVIMIIRANGGRNIWETNGMACYSLALAHA